MTRKDVLNQLKTDLEESLTLANGYNTEPVEIIYGVTTFDDVIMKPVVGFSKGLDIIEEEDCDDERERILNITVYGYANISLNDNDPIDDLVDSVEKFLYSDHWTYHDQTLLGNVTFFIGGEENDQALFILEIKVYYTQTF